MIGKNICKPAPMTEAGTGREWACLSPAGLWLWPWSETAFAVAGWEWLAVGEDAGF